MNEGEISISLTTKGLVVGFYTAGSVPKVGDTITYEELAITERVKKKFIVDLADFEWRVVNNKLRTVFINVTEAVG